MTGLLTLFLNLTVWLLVPGILITLLRLTSIAHQRAEDARHALAEKSGFWAGVMLAIIALIYQISLFMPDGFPADPFYGGFDIWLAVTGAIASLILFGGAGKSLSPKAAGVFIMGITFLALWALAHYLLIHTQNQFILSFVLGGTFGVLMHFAVSPSSLRTFLKF